MVNPKRLALIILLAIILVSSGVFYVLPSSKWKRKYHNLLEYYSESQELIIKLHGNITHLSYIYDLLDEQYDTLQRDYHSLKKENKLFQLEYDRLNERYSHLQEKYSNLQGEINPPPPPFSGDSGASPDVAAEIGTRVTCNFRYNKEQGYECVIKVVNVTHGKKAYDELKLEYVDIQSPRSEYHFFLVKIQIEYIKAPKPLKFDKGFHLFSINGILYDPPSVYSLKPYLGNITFYKDWRAEGWLTFEVPETETTPLLSFASGGNFSSGYWFKLF